VIYFSNGISSEIK
jgi:thioredoxin-like negative regulator of GroEL